MTQIPLGSMFQAMPGIGAALDSFENQFWYQGWHQLRRQPAVIAGTARDAGNTANTKVLRAGLAMGGPILSTDATNPYKFAQWDQSAVDGSQYFFGFLPYNLTVYDQTGANIDRYADLIVSGSVYSDRVIIASETNTGLNNNYGSNLLALAQQRFLFDKNVASILPNCPLPMITLSTLGATPNTLTAAHAGRVFNNIGDVASRTVNLPAALPGLGPFRFYRIAAQAVVLDAGTNTFVAPGNVAADTLTIASAGGYVEVIGISTTQYMVTDAAGTITPA